MTERRRIKNRPEPLGPDGLTASERAEGYVLISKPGAILRVLSRPHTAAEREALNIGSARLPGSSRAEIDAKEAVRVEFWRRVFGTLTDPGVIALGLFILFCVVWSATPALWKVFHAGH